MHILSKCISRRSVSPPISPTVRAVIYAKRMEEVYRTGRYTDKKENQIFLLYKEVQNGAVAKSHMTNGLLINDEIFAHFLIYQEALPHLRLCNCTILNFLIFRKFYFLFQCILAPILKKFLAYVDSLFRLFLFT